MQIGIVSNVKIEFDYMKHIPRERDCLSLHIYTMRFALYSWAWFVVFTALSDVNYGPPSWSLPSSMGIRLHGSPVLINKRFSLSSIMCSSLWATVG